MKINSMKSVSYPEIANTNVYIFANFECIQIGKLFALFPYKMCVCTHHTDQMIDTCKMCDQPVLQYKQRNVAKETVLLVVIHPN